MSESSSFPQPHGNDQDFVLAALEADNADLSERMAALWATATPPELTVQEAAVRALVASLPGVQVSQLEVLHLPGRSTVSVRVTLRSGLALVATGVELEDVDALHFLLMTPDSDAWVELCSEGRCGWVVGLTIRNVEDGEPAGTVRFACDSLYQQHNNS